jgi:hypothetical protein
VRCTVWRVFQFGSRERENFAGFLLAVLLGIVGFFLLKATSDLRDWRLGVVAGLIGVSAAGLTNLRVRNQDTADRRLEAGLTLSLALIGGTATSFIAGGPVWGAAFLIGAVIASGLTLYLAGKVATTAPNGTRPAWTKAIWIALREPLFYRGLAILGVAIAGLAHVYNAADRDYIERSVKNICVHQRIDDDRGCEGLARKVARTRLTAR